MPRKRAIALALVMAVGAQTAAAQGGKGGQAGAAPAAAPTTSGAGASGALAVLEARFPAGEAGAFRDWLASAPAGVTGDTIGHLLFARRQFDRAAWFFGEDAALDPDDPVSLNNFAAMLIATHADGGWPDELLAAAAEAARRAVALDGSVAAYHATQSNAARRLGLAEEAVAAGERAVALAPDEPLYWSHLARARALAGDEAGAAEALARARALSPNSLVVAMARQALPSGGAYDEAMARSCDVNFRCQEICPKSIIGGIMSVTCEIENSNAQQLCLEGKPYPVAYDCREDLPEYGILIPGLNAGFSVAVPGFSAHVVVDGEGNVDVRVEAGVSMGPVGAYVRGDGHYSPDGGVSFDNLGGGVRVSVLPSSPAGTLASDLGHPPFHIEAETLNGQPPQINVETYNAGVISY